MFVASFELLCLVLGDIKLSPYIFPGKHSLSPLLSTSSSKESEGLVGTVVREKVLSVHKLWKIIVQFLLLQDYSLQKGLCCASSSRNIHPKSSNFMTVLFSFTV